MDKKFQLREAFDKLGVIKLAQRIKKVYPNFNDERFTESINSEIDKLNFGARQELIIFNLEKFLPKEFTKSAGILIDSLEHELEKTELTGFQGIITVPVTKYIARHGLKNFELSMKALYEMTKRFSSEEAIRTFIRNFPEETLKKLHEWTNDKNPHVRRLVSEGTRPRLPLCSPLTEFKKNPLHVIELLDKLKDDKILLVRRSVANNMNDISKDNPDVAIDVLRRWGIDANKETIWIINHALRTLFKRGNKDALELLGYLKPDGIISDLSLKKDKLRLGDNLYFSFKLESYIQQKLMIDYAIHFMKSNGKKSWKVFKLSRKMAEKDEKLFLSKKHSFREMTTRRHYSGEHILEIIINGYRFDKKSFFLCF